MSEIKRGAGPPTYLSMPPGNEMAGWRPISLFKHRQAASVCMTNTCRDYHISARCIEIYKFRNTEKTQVGWGVYVPTDAVQSTALIVAPAQAPLTQADAKPDLDTPWKCLTEEQKKARLDYYSESSCCKRSSPALPAPLPAMAKVFVSAGGAK
jgi:hypothetical protein